MGKIRDLLLSCREYLRMVNHCEPSEEEIVAEYQEMMQKMKAIKVSSEPKLLFSITNALKKVQKSDCRFLGDQAAIIERDISALIRNSLTSILVAHGKSAEPVFALIKDLGLK